MADLKGIAKIYNESVEQVDKKGNAEKFKSAAEILFGILKKHSFTPIDIEYLDGYFIFGTGTNSVVHFHVKECPKWKFGIWFNATDSAEDIRVHFFTQHEDYIDKFKPSASSFTESFLVHLNYDYSREWYTEAFIIIDMVNFIKKEPCLAFYAHMYSFDKYKYVTRFKAWRYKVYFIVMQKKEEHKKNKEKRIIDKWTKKHLGAFVKKHPELSYEIIDCGEGVRPRYEPVIYFPKDMIEEDPVYIDFRKLLKEYKAVTKKQGDGWIYSDWIIEKVKKDEND